MTEYSIESLIKSKVNDELFSDVSFLIGENETKMYANKSILRLGSPAFDRMFFGEIPMDCSRPIAIPDLSPAGFLNMLKYIYGHGFEMDLTELYSTWQAGDKYLVHNFENNLCNYIKKSTRKSNIWLVYDQLIKIQRDNGLLDQVKEILKLCGKNVFDLEYFLELSEDVLVDILKIDWLNMAEIDILKACLIWIERQIVKLDLQPTRDNKIQLFQPLKPYIRFSDLQICEIGIFEEIRNLLTDNEITSLFFHLSDRSKPIPIEYQGHRILNANCSLKIIQSVSISKDLSNANGPLDVIETYLKCNQVAYITSIVTLSALRNRNKLELYIFRNGSLLDLQYEKTRINEEWHFKFSQCLILNPGDVYQLSFRFMKYIFCSTHELSDQWQLEFNDNKHCLDFTLKPVASNKLYHCVKQIEFTFFPDIYNAKRLAGLH